MPYIKKDFREHLEPELSELILKIKDSSFDDRDGVCNYVISSIVAGAMKPETGWRYHWIARAVAVFAAAGAEFYRRVAAPYEDAAIAKNGDIVQYE